MPTPQQVIYILDPAARDASFVREVRYKQNPVGYDLILTYDREAILKAVKSSKIIKDAPFFPDAEYIGHTQDYIHGILKERFWQSGTAHRAFVDIVKTMDGTENPQLKVRVRQPEHWLPVKEVFDIVCRRDGTHDPHLFFPANLKEKFLDKIYVKEPAYLPITPDAQDRQARDDAETSAIPDLMKPGEELQRITDEDESHIAPEKQHKPTQVLFGSIQPLKINTGTYALTKGECEKTLITHLRLEVEQVKQRSHWKAMYIPSLVITYDVRRLLNILRFQKDGEGNELYPGLTHAIGNGQSQVDEEFFKDLTTQTLDSFQSAMKTRLKGTPYADQHWRANCDGKRKVEMQVYLPSFNTHAAACEFLEQLERGDSDPALFLPKSATCAFKAYLNRDPNRGDGNGPIKGGGNPPDKKRLEEMEKNSSKNDAPPTEAYPKFRTATGMATGFFVQREAQRGFNAPSATGKIGK